MNDLPQACYDQKNEKYKNEIPKYYSDTCTVCLCKTDISFNYYHFGYKLQS